MRSRRVIGPDDFTIGETVRSPVKKSRGLGKIAEITPSKVIVEWLSGGRTHFTFSYLNGDGDGMLVSSAE